MIHSSRRPRSVLTPDLAERLKTHKADLLTILRPAGALGDDDLAPAVDAITTPENQAKVATGLNGWDDAIEPPAPCPACGGLMFWWNPLGDRRCLRCDSPKTAIRLLEKAERLRRRCGLPSPAGAAEMLADLKRLTDTCNSAQ